MNSMVLFSLIFVVVAIIIFAFYKTMKPSVNTSFLTNMFNFNELKFKETKSSDNLASVVNICAKNKDFETAKAEIKMLLAINAKNRDNIISKYAQICILNNNSEEAIGFLKNELKKTPENELFKTILADLYESVDSFEYAVELYKDIIINASSEDDRKKFEKKLASIYSDWGVSFFDKDDFSSEIDYFMISLKYDMENSDIYFNLGKLNYKIKNYEDAVSYFQKTMKMSGEDSDLWLNLGYVYEDTNEYDIAEKCYNKAIILDKNNLRARISIAVLYATQEMFQSAIDELKTVLELNPENEDAYYNLALVYENINDFQSAIEYYKKVLKINNKNENAKNNLELLLNN